jgi:hypothetical protein
MRNLLALAKAAKAVITPKGTWTKHARERGYTHCMLGAIEEALSLAPETAELDERGAALIKALARELGVREYAAYRAAFTGYFSDLCYITHCAAVIIKFNDAKTTTQHKVLGLFQRVIDRLEGEAKHRRWRQQVRQLLKGATTKAMQSPAKVAA